MVQQIVLHQHWIIKLKVEKWLLTRLQFTLFILAVDTDPTNYDVYLYEAISHQLAADLCYAITNNSTLANNYMTRADERLREARFIDATENALDTLKQTNLLMLDCNDTKRFLIQEKLESIQNENIYYIFNGTMEQKKFVVML